MPTAYLKKLAKLNNTSVDKLEKFWSQAKEIAKSEGQGKSWGLITTIFQNKLKKEGFKVKAFFTLSSIENREEITDNLGAIKFLKSYKNMKFTPATYLFGLLVGYASLSNSHNIKVKDLKEQSYDVFGDDSVLKNCKTVEDVIEVCKKESPKYVRKFNSFIMKYSSKYIYRADDCRKDDLDINKLGVCWTSSKGFVYHYAINLTEPTITCALFDYNNIDWILTTAISITTEGEMVNEVRIKNPQKLKIVNIKSITVDSLYEKVFKFVDVLEKYYGVQLSKKSVPITNRLLEKYTGWGFWKVKDFVFNHGNNVSLFIKKVPKKPSNYKVDAFTSLADTDELDDADLGINVDHKEYHKQKSLQMSLKSKLDMIKKDLNKEADSYNKELLSIAKRLNEENRKRFSQDNHGDKWLNYKGNVTKEVLLEAFKDGVKGGYTGFGTISSDNDIRDELNYYKNSIYPRFAKLLKGSSLRVYRGLDFFDLISKDKEHELNKYLKYLKYNLMDRNSWSTSIETAKRYINYKFAGIILRMDCTLEDANLPLSAWLEGYWYENGGNEEINLKKSFKVNDIKCVFVGSSLEKLFDMNKFNSTKTLAFYEPDALDSTTENKLDYISQVKECIKKIWARGINQEQKAKEWSNNYGNLISDCFYKNIEPKVCARMCYIKYHKENPYTMHLNEDNDVSFDKLLSEANKYFNHLKELKKNNSIITSSTKSFDKVGSDGTKYSFEKLTSAKDVVELLKGITIIDDYFNENDEYFKRKYGVSKKEATLGDVGWDEDIVIYIKYNNGKEWYSVDTESKLNDLKLSGIKDVILDWYGSTTSYYGKDCRIEKYDEDEDSPFVVKCSKGEIMSKFNKITSKYNVYLYNGRVVTASNKYELLRENANTKKLMDKIKEDTWDDIEV